MPFIARTSAAEDNTQSSILNTRYFPREDVYTRIRLKTGTANPFAPLVIYTWIGGSSTFNTATNWSPNRTTPAAGDQLAFNDGGTYTVTNLSTQTIAELVVSGGTNVTFQGAVASPTNALTITGPLTVATGSALNVSGSNPVSITVNAASQGSISGSMNFAGGVHQLLGGAASAITFNSGSSFTQGASINDVFGGSGTPNTIIFASGSTFTQQGGNNPFGLSQPASKVVFQTGSLYRITASLTPAFSGRTYSHFEWHPGSGSQSPSGTSAVLIDNLTITSGTLNFNMTGTPGHAIRGNISVASGATLTFSPGAAGTINLSGTGAQTISGTGTLTINSTATISVSNATGVTLQRNVATSGPFNVVSGGVFNTGTNVLSGTGTFNLQPGGTLGIGSADGITTFPSATGNIQNLNRIYNAAGNYNYEGTSAQVTGTGLPTTLSGVLRLNNTSGVTLSQSTTHNGSISVVSGAFNTGAFSLTVNNTLANSGTFNVSSGGTLKGTGTVTGPTTVASGGTVAPGVSPGIINTGNVSFTSGSTFDVEINGTTAGTDYDQLNVTGTVALGGANLNVTLGFTPAANDTFTIINNDSSDAVSGTFAGLGEGGTFTVSGTTFAISYVGGTGNDVVLTAQAPPILKYRSVQSGNWNAPSTWETSPDGTTWSPAASTPTSADDTITIQSGHTVIQNGSLTVDQVTVDGLLAVALGTLTNNGPMTVNGTFQLNEQGIVSGTALTYGANGTLSYNGAGTNQTTSAIEFPSSSGPNNLIIGAGTGTTVFLNFDRTINGTLNLLAGPFSIGANTLTLNGSVSTGSGSLTGGSTSKISFGGSGASTTLPAVSGGLNTLTIDRANGIALGGAVSVSGTLNLTSGTLTNGANLTLGDLTTINRASTGAITGTPTFANRVFLNYTGGGNYTTGPELPTSAAAVRDFVTTNPTPFTLTLGGNLTVNNVFLVNGGSLDTAANTLTLSGGTNQIGSGIVTVGSGGTFNLNNSLAFLVSGVGIVVNGTLSQPTGAVLSGAGTVTVNSGGTATLGAANTYTGATSVSGTLAVNGSTAAGSAVSINSGGTLKGTGTVSGSTTVASGGTVAPGLSPGIIDSGSVTFTSGSNFDVEINGTTVGTQYDQLNVTGTVALGGATLNVTLGYTPASGDAFTIINSDGVDAVTGTFAGLAEGATFTVSGTTFQISYVGGTGNDVVLTVLPPPDISIADASQAEGNGPGTTTMSFTVTRSGDLSGTSTVNYSTTAGTATQGPCSTAGNDYESASGMVTFAPTDDTETINVTICGDTTAEPDETFTVNLATPTNATISDSTGDGTIQNDDGSVTYTWDPTSAQALVLCAAQANQWTCPGNWTPLRPTATAVSTVTTDILIFNGTVTPSPTILNVPTQSVAAIQFTNNINEAKFEATLGPATLTINGDSGSDFSIASGSAVRLQGTNAITISLTAAGQEGLIAGNLIFQGAAHKLTGANAGEIRFNSTSIFTTTTGFTGHPFGSGTDGSVIFDGGSNSFFGAGSDPFGGAGKNIVSFGLVPMSSQEFSAASAFDSNGRTYGNLTLTGGQTYVGSGTGLFVVFGNFVLQSTSTLTLSGSAGGDMVVNGNFTNDGALTPNGRTVTFSGIGSQTINTGGSGAGKAFFGLNVTNSGGGVTVNGSLGMNATGPLGLTYASGTPTFAMTNGSFNLVNTIPVTVSPTSQLGAGNYVLISAGSGGSVTGTAPSNLTIAGSGIAPGTSASLQITGNELVLVVVAPETTVAVTSGNLVITDGNGGTSNDTLTISLNGNAIRVNDPNNTLSCVAPAIQFDANTCDVPQGSVTGNIQVNTLDGSDSLTINYSGGNPLPAAGLVYAGGIGTTDTLAITGGSAATITHTFTNANDGSVTVDGTVITYTGLEPLTDNMSAVDRVFTFTGGAETITVADAAGANMTIDSTLGESVTFANPTGSLTINAGTGTDAITITSVDAAYNVDLTINGDADSDTVNLNGDITFASGENLTVNAETLNTGASADLTTSGAGIIIATADDVALNGTSTLVSASAVIIRQQTAGRPINLGTETGGSLSLTDGEIGRITAGTLQIGDVSSGSITFSGATPIDVTDGPTIATVILVTAGAINSNSTPAVLDIVAAELNLTSITGIDIEMNADTLTTSSANLQSLSELNSVTVGNNDINASGFTLTLASGRFNTTAAGGNILANLVVVQAPATLGGTGTVTTTGSGTTVNGTVSPGVSPGILNTGDVTFNSGSSFNVEINNTTVGTGYDQLNVTGTVTLGGATLNLSGTHTPVIGDTFTIIANDSTDAVTPAFTMGTGGTDSNGGTLAEGDTITNFLGSLTVNATVTYAGGSDSNDVVLTAVTACVPPATVYVDDDWVGTTPGTDPDAGGPATNFGCDSFATIQGGVDGVTDPGTVIVNAGTYTETVTVNKQLSIRGAQFGVDARTRGAVPESIVNSAGGSFILTASGIELNGFTVQDASTTTAAGIVTDIAASGYQIRNNIIKDNRIGLYLRSSGATQAVVEKNLIRDNNKTGGTSFGNGLFSNGVSNALIENNLFAGMTPTSAPIPFSQRALHLAGSSSVLIKTNAFADGNGVWLSNVDGSEFSGNALTGSQPVGGTNVAGLSIQDGTDNLLVSQNTFTNRGNVAAISSGGTTVSNLNVTITLNTVTHDVTTSTGQRIVMGFNRFGGTSNITENTITLTGALPAGAKIHGMDVSGSTGLVGTVNILRNTINGGNTDVVNATDASVGVVISPGGLGGSPGATINVNNNFINGWINGVSTDSTGFGTATLLSTTTVAVTGNDLSGNANKNVVAHSSGPVFNASANWHGSAVFATVQGKITGTTVDYTPYLNAGTDTAGTAGFQGDFSSLTVHASGNQFGSTARIQEGIGLVTSGGTVKVLTGTYTGNVDATSKSVILAAGASPGQVTINGNFTLDSDDTLPIEIDGTSAATQYDNFIINGSVTLGNAALVVSGTYTPAAADSFTIINNDTNADAVVGTFNGLPEGTLVNVNGKNKKITYVGGDGNDVVLLALNADLSVTKTDSPDPVTEGNALTYTLTVSNAGPDAASDVVLTDTLPGSVTFVSATPSQGSPCTGTATVTCNLGTINNAANATVQIVVIPNTPGTITNNLTATAFEVDATPASDNEDTLVNAAVCTAPAAGMVGWWPGEGNANDIQAPTFENGTLQGGATFDAGKVNQAFKFDGVDDYVSQTLPANVKTPNVTIDAWVNLAAINNTGLGQVIAAAQPIGSNGIGLGVYLSIGADGRANFTKGSGGPFVNVVGTTVLSTGLWYHVAGTYDGATMRVYVNGVEEGSLADAQPISWTDAGAGNYPDPAQLYFGAYKTNQIGAGATVPDTGFLNGRLDEIEIFTSALSAGDIAAIYNASFAGKCHTNTIQFSSATYSEAENVGGGNATITVTRAGAVDGTATVDYATITGGSANAGSGNCNAPADYQTVTNTLNFAAYETSKTFTIPICDETIFETDETVNLQLSNVTGAGASLGTPDTATLTITNDDPIPTISIDDVTAFEGDIGTTDFNFTVSLSNPSYQTITVTAQTADGTALTSNADYNGAGPTILTFSPNTTTQPFQVQANGDTTFEQDETFVVNLSLPSNATISDPQGTGTITNDDAAPSLSINDLTTTEGTTAVPPLTKQFNFTVTKTGTTNEQATVTFQTGDDTGGVSPATSGADCSTPGVDYIPNSGSVIFPASGPGSTSQTVTILVCRDGAFEGNETFLVNLSGPVNAIISDGQAVGTITNDDVPSGGFVVNTTADGDDGSCLPIGSGNGCTLREAINAANASPAATAINFAIPANDARHFYYKDDGVPNQVTHDVAHVLVTTAANDAALPVDKDPDWPHGWWSILPASALPTVTQAATVDGYTQTEAAVNTSATSTNAVLRIEVEGSSAGAAVTGLVVSNGSSIVRGLVINRFTGNGLQSSGAVTGNFIGTDVSGTLDLGNTGTGVVGANNMTIGGNTPQLANLLSGNDTHGILFTNFNSSIVHGNYIGTRADGVSALGNGGNGIHLTGGSAVFNTIGGTAAGEPNVIAFNGNDGVSLPDAGVGNVIRGNSIFSNGTTATHLGIDHGPVDGVTANDAAPDADSGPNALQNFPVIQSAVVGSPNVISGTLSSVPNQTFTIDLYANTTCDASGNGEGKTYLGSTTTTTDASGLGGWRFIPATLNLTDQITATATSATNSTSEFSQCFTPTTFSAGQLQFAQTAISDPETNTGSHTVTFTVQRVGGSNRPASVNYTINDGSATIADNDYSVGSPTGTLQWPNGDSTDRTITITVNGDTKYEGDETLTIVLSSPVGATIAGSNTATLTITDDDLLLVDDDLVQCPTAAYTTIQSAINAALAGQTVQVCAGTYAEQVDINKSLTVLGPNANINPNTGVRVAEAVIIPTSSDPLNPSFAGPIVVTLSASGVTFRGFTVDGNTPAFTSGVVFNGSDVDAEFGIYGDGSANMDAVIENNIVQNIGEIAIWLNTFGFGGPRNANTRINANKVDNVLGAFGQALRISDDCWADITSNVVTRSRVGIVIENFGGSVTTHPASVIENNEVTAFRIGIRHNTHYVYGSPGFTIRNNTVTSYVQTPMPPQVTTPTTYEGIRVEQIQQTVDVDVTNNTVDGNRATLQTAGYTRVEGLGLTNASTTSPNISFTGNRVSDSIRGVFHDTPAVPTFTCNTIVGNSTGVEISASATNGLIANNNNIFGNGVGMLNNSPAGSINAESNYWGSATGPTIASNPAGTGDSITGTGALAVDYDPFLTSAASCGPVAPPTISKAFGTVSVPPNGSTTLSFTLGNPNSSTLTGIGFNDPLPSGLIVSTPNGLTGSCGGGTITAADGSSNISLSGGTLAGGATCTFTVNVEVNTLGAKNNTTDNVTSTEGGIGGTASATLNVTPPSLAISDVTLAEGTGGTTNFVFTVTKTGDGATDVNFTTVDGTAQDDNPASEDNDYTPNNGTLSFGVTEPSKTITVVVNGDTTPELIENFTVVLSGPTGGATFTDDTGLGTILNDDESAAAGQLTISEFRLSGPGANATEQANNEFIELYNSTDQDLFVTTTDGSTGWAVANSSGVPIFFVPNGTTIPARGHFLGTNTTGYSLKDYGGTDAALGDATWTTDIPDNTALAVFRTNTAANFNATNRLDSVGPNTETNPLYKEAAGYAPLAPADLAQNLEHTFFRQICVFQAGCPTPGRPRDTQDNAADFIFGDTTGVPTSAGQRLGSPGPENLASPIKRDPAINLVLLDATVSEAAAPNRARDATSDPVNASLFGTMTIRRRVVNQTGGTVTRLRFRVIDMTTLPSGPSADLRLRSSSNEVISVVNDANTCASTGTPTTVPCSVNVTGLTLEQPPNHPPANGGGLNTTVTLPLSGGLPNGQSINVNFLLGVQKTGPFRFYLVIEALP